MSADETTTCQCGHASDWHEIEPPYSCMTCECMAFRLYVPPSPSADRDRVDCAPCNGTGNDGFGHPCQWCQQAPPVTADRARVEAVRATLLELEIEAKGFATFTQRDPSQHAHYSQRAAALREAATWAPPGDEGLRAALTDEQTTKLLKLKAKAEHVTAINPTATIAVNGVLLLRLIAALAAVSPLPQKEQRDET